jgi:hypothetical protein
MWLLLIPPAAVFLTIAWVALRSRPDRTSEAMITIEGYRRSLAALARPITPQPAAPSSRPGADLDDPYFPDPPPFSDPPRIDDDLSRLGDLSRLEDLPRFGESRPTADSLPATGPLPLADPPAQGPSELS